MPDQAPFMHDDPSDLPPANIIHSRNIWFYSLFNLALLIVLGLWFWHNNQPQTLAEPTMAKDGKLQCISYAPYYGKDQTPYLKYQTIPHAQIDHDLQLLAQHFECVRIYSVGQGLDYVPEAASRLGLKVLVGAWIGWIKADNDKELNLAIATANAYPDTVTALIVGNEVLLRKEQTEAAMQAYLQKAKAGTKVPVTYADVWEFWLKHKNLEKSVDFVTVHILPYWEDKPQPIERAVAHTNNIMNKLAENFSKPILIGETGWPSIGRQRDGSVPSQINQARYLREFLQAAQDKGWRYNMIEAIDQPWKRILEGTVGGYWGLYDTDFQPKFSFSGAMSERHDDWTLAGWAVAGALLLCGFLLNAKAASARNLLAMASLGALAGAAALLQMEYLVTACRTNVEWAVLGALVVVGWLALAAIPYMLVEKQQAMARKLLNLSLFLLVLGALIANLLQVTDGRYRDFPLVLYALPVLQLSIGASMLGISFRNTWHYYRRINSISVITAIISACVEADNLQAWHNTDAWLWTGLTLLLALVSWPKKRPAVAEMA